MNNASVFKTIYEEDVYSIPFPVTIVIGIPWNELKEDHRQLLNKILKAVKLSLEAVRILHQASLDLSSWSEKPGRMVAFVAPPKGFKHYEVIQTGETSVVFSDPLEFLNTDEAAKRNLWIALRALFPS